MLKIPFFGSWIYVSLRHIWASQFRDQRNGWAKDLIFFSKRKNFSKFFWWCIYVFSVNLTNFFRLLKNIEKTKIICTIVLWGKVSLKCQPSLPPDPWGVRRGETMSLLLGLPFTSSVATYTSSWIFENIPQNGPEYSHRNLAIARFLVTAVRKNIGGLLSWLVSLSSSVPELTRHGLGRGLHVNP